LAHDAALRAAREEQADGLADEDPHPSVRPAQQPPIDRVGDVHGQPPARARLRGVLQDALPPGELSLALCHGATLPARCRPAQAPTRIVGITPEWSSAAN